MLYRTGLKRGRNADGAVFTWRSGVSPVQPVTTAALTAAPQQLDEECGQG